MVAFRLAGRARTHFFSGMNQMKTKTWGIFAVVGVIASVGLGLWFQNQSAVVYGAGEDVSAVDLGIKNGVGFGMAGTILATIVAAWKSGSPARIIQTLCLIGLWATSFSNESASAKINELAVLLSAEPKVDPVVPDEVTKSITDKVLDAWKNLVKEGQAPVPATTK